MCDILASGRKELKKFSSVDLEKVDIVKAMQAQR